MMLPYKMMNDDVSHVVRRRGRVDDEDGDNEQNPRELANSATVFDVRAVFSVATSSLSAWGSSPAVTHRYRARLAQ